MCWPRTDYPFPAYPPSKQTKRDATGITGPGLGVLNGLDVEVLLNKPSATTSDLSKLQHPLQSSLLALGTNQWLLSDILPLWEKNNERDHWLIVEALGMVQGNLSLVLRCIHTQLWMHSTVTAITRVGKHSTLPIEVWEVAWDNTTGREFQSWWCLGNYDPINNKVAVSISII